MPIRLPPGWGETIDAKGRTYYFNAQTQESSWTPPPGSINEDNKPPVLPPVPSPQSAQPRPPAFNSGPPSVASLSVASNAPSTASQYGFRGPPPVTTQGGPPPLAQMSSGPPPVNVPPTFPGGRGGPPPVNTAGHSIPPQFGSAPPAFKPPSLPPSVPPSIPSPQSSNVPPAFTPPQGPPAFTPPQGPPAFTPPQGPPAFGAPGQAPPPHRLSAAPPPIQSISLAAAIGNSPMYNTSPPAVPQAQSVPVNAMAPPSFSPQTSGASLPPPQPQQQTSLPPPVALSVNISQPPSLPPSAATTPRAPVAPIAPIVPPSPMSASMQPALPAPWKETTAPNGRIYYYNPETQETSWTRPTAATGGTPTSAARLTMDFGKSSPLSGVGNTFNAQSQQQQVVDDTPAVIQPFTLTHTGPVNIRGGVFKSWDTKYISVQTRGQLTTYDNEQMKKDRIKINLEHSIIIPLLKYDGRNVLIIHEFSPKIQRSIEMPVSKSDKQLYLDLGTTDALNKFASLLENQGALVRRPLWESQGTVNKEQRYIMVFDHQIEFYKKSLDDEPDHILQYTASTFFQSVPSTFPLLYDEKIYGTISPQTFIIADNCNPDVTLYYVTMSTPTTGYESYIKKLSQSIQQRVTKVNPNSIFEGYMYKASSNLQRWARRYMILLNDSLSYYKERGADKPAGIIDLPNGFEVDLTSTQTTHPFSLFVSESGDEGTRQYLICALNTPEYEQWCNVIMTLNKQKMVKKDPNSVKEGYVYLCGKKTKPARRYCVVSQTNIQFYHFRRDINPVHSTQLKHGSAVSDATLPGDDTINNVRLQMLSLANPTGDNDHVTVNAKTGAPAVEDLYIGFNDAHTREEWSTVLKGIVGETVSKCHADSFLEGFMYKSRKKGSLGSIKYVVITPRAVYYSDRKTPHLDQNDVANSKGVKHWALAGLEAPIVDDDSIQGYYGLSIASTGDDTGIEYMYLYFGSDQERKTAQIALQNAQATVDWRRDPTSFAEGYIYRGNSQGKSFTRRYMILHRNAATFYKRKFDQQAAGRTELPQGFSVAKISQQDPLISGDNKTAITQLASALKMKGQELYGLAITPPAHATTAKRFFLGSAVPSEVVQWQSFLTDVATLDRIEHPGSLKEGYLCYGSTLTSARRYIVIRKDKIEIYPSKQDHHLQETIYLHPGFDIIAKYSVMYFSPTGNADLEQYTKFALGPGSDTIEKWLEVFQEAYIANTPSIAQDVYYQDYGYVSSETTRPQYRFIVITNNTVAFFESRQQCYPNTSNTTPQLHNAVNKISFTLHSNQTQLTSINLDTLKITIQGTTTWIIHFRTPEAKTHAYDTIDALFSVQRAPRQSYATRPAAFAACVHTAPSTAHHTQSTSLQAPSSAVPSAPSTPSFSSAIPPAPRQAFTPTMPAMPFFDEDDAPPPPPPPEDDDDWGPVPAIPEDEPYVPPAIISQLPTPVAVALPPPVDINAPPTSPGSSTFVAPDFDDDDDDIPDFLKKARQDKQGGGAAPSSGFKPPTRQVEAAAPAPAPPAPVFTPAPPVAAPAPAYTPAPVVSSSYAPPATDNSSFALDLDFDMAFDLPPPPEEMTLPPPPVQTFSSAPIPPPTVASAYVEPPRARPAFGHKSAATVAAEAKASLYTPVDDDDDDLPPPPM